MSSRLRGTRGATLVEYALGMALVLVACIGALQALERSAEDEVSTRSARVGDPDSEVAAPPPPVGGDDEGTDSEEPPPETVTVQMVPSVSARWTSTSPPRWEATVAFVVTSDGEPAPNVAITGTWDPSADTSETTCLTDENGECQVIRWALNNGTATATFTPSDVSEGYAVEGGLQGVVVDRPAP